MRTLPRPSSHSVIACSLVLAVCGGLEAYGEEEGNAGKPYTVVTSIPYIAPPAGFGRYCSKTFPNGTHELAWGDHASDPCNYSQNGTIRHAGLWDMNGPNRVFVRCTNGGLTVDAPASGRANLITAQDAVSATGSCQFLVAPKSLPIFRHPWLVKHNQYMGAGNGVDFAFDTFQRPGPFSYRWSDIGCSPGVQGSTTTTTLDEKGHEVAGSNNHSGYDWAKRIKGQLDHDWGVRSVAAGRVLMARTRSASMSCSGQKDIYLEHRVGWKDTPYFENFISYYAHLDDFEVSDNQNVDSGDLLGNAGTSGSAAGCVSPSTNTHLHMSVYRVRNVKGALEDFPDFSSPTHWDERRMVDPFGWNASCGSDPWARLAPDGEGAPSSNLWRPGLAPPRADHSGH